MSVDKNLRQEFGALWARGIWEFETNGLPVLGPKCCVFVEVPHEWFYERHIRPIGEPLLDKPAYKVPFIEFLDYVAFKECQA